MSEPVVYVEGGVAYEARGETLIIDFDELKEAGATREEKDEIEHYVEIGDVDGARELYSNILRSAEEKR